MRFEDMPPTTALVGWAASQHESLHRAQAAPFVAGSLNLARRRAFGHAAARFEGLRYGDVRRRGSNVLWPIDEGTARWAYSVEFEEIDGEEVPVSITVTPAPLSNAPLTADAYRVPLATIINISRAAIDPESRERRRRELVEAHRERSARVPAGLKTPPLRAGWLELAESSSGGKRERAGRPRLSDTFLASVAVIFEAAVSAGRRDPARAVREIISAERGREPSP